MKLFVTKLIGSEDKLYVASEDIEAIKRMAYDENPIHEIEINTEETGD